MKLTKILLAFAFTALCATTSAQAEEVDCPTAAECKARGGTVNSPFCNTMQGGHRTSTRLCAAEDEITPEDRKRGYKTVPGSDSDDE